MWTVRSEKLTREQGLRFAVDLDAKPATYAEVINAWQMDASFQSLVNAVLAETPYTAFRWETPSVSTGNLTRPFEFVVLDSPGLERASDPDAYAEYFSLAKAGISTFSNLGGDATLVVPCPLVDATAYGHLAAFVRRAPATQQAALWQAIGDAMARRIGPKPVWLSTAGAGVPWLHVRLDDRPKYYGYRPYVLDGPIA